MSAGKQPMVQLGGKPFTATRNACKLCAPLGASLAFRGVEGAMPFLHGSQGCSTYIRRYMISHFREPMDIACANFDEAAAVFGGQKNLRDGLANVARQYRPALIGVATTCLAETIGENVPMLLHEIRSQLPDDLLPPVVHVSTPSYAGTHSEGFHAAVAALVETLAEPGAGEEHLTLMPGMVSPADIRYLKQLVRDFGLAATLLPDYSDTLDGPVWTQYQRIPPGGTSVAEIRRAGCSRAAIEWSGIWDHQQSAGASLEKKCGVPRHLLPMPIGVQATDQLVGLLESISGRGLPEAHAAERGRLVDALVDAHKYVFGKRVAVCGDPDLVVGIAGLLAEIGAVPALCATGAQTGRLPQAIRDVSPDLTADITCLEGVDFVEIEEAGEELGIDLIVGNSKAFKMSRKLEVPLVRVGFPIHDRVGASRVQHLGYRGTQQLFDRIVNCLLEVKQSSSPIGYTYL